MIQILTTVGKKEEGQTIAQALLEKKLAACVQIVGPIESRYRWKGKIETAEEWLLLIKTRDGLYADVEKTIRDLHSYETPEVVAIPVTKGSRDYFDWLDAETK